MTAEEMTIIDEQSVKDMVYEVRGQKVMLDFDLARIYGYETKAFNQQVTRNIERFPKEFRFKLDRFEVDGLVRSQNVTSRKSSIFSGQSGGLRYLPYAFTEQGVYMLMTVLRGELAVKQSIALIKAFKALKDVAIHYGLSQDLVPLRLGALEERVKSQGKEIAQIQSELGSVVKQFTEIESRKEWFLMGGERVEASLLFKQIYPMANKSVILIDDYIGPKTLLYLKACRSGVGITIFSDQVSKPKLKERDFENFFEDTGICITIKPSRGLVHDRYIVLDYGTSKETVYHCGASSKDAGNKATAIMQVENPQDYHRLVDALLGNPR